MKSFYAVRGVIAELLGDAVMLALIQLIVTGVV